MAILVVGGIPVLSDRQTFTVIRTEVQVLGGIDRWASHRSL